MRQGRLQRVAIIAFAATITGIMGIRAPRGRAVSFEDIRLQGMGRAALTVEETRPAPPEGTSNANEVFARMIYATELSGFGAGLYIRSSFTLPATRETAVLVIDVDRARGQKQWQAGASGLRARFYTLASRDAKVPRFDGTPSAGVVELEASVVGANQAGFRLTGGLTFHDPGNDGISGNDDDGVFEVELELESVPAPEEIAGQPVRPVPQPVDDYCDPVWCWEDDGYDNGYWYGPGCGDADVGYEATDSGCEGDTVDDDPGTTGGSGSGSVDGVYDPYDPYGTAGDGGCSSPSDDPNSDGSSDSTAGCTGSDDSSGTSSDGCDGGDDSSTSSGCSDTSSSDSSSGCADSGSSSGCSDSSSGCGDSGASACGGGCQGDTLQRAPASSNVQGSDVGWIAIGLFFGSIGVAGRRRDDD